MKPETGTVFHIHLTIFFKCVRVRNFILIFLFMLNVKLNADVTMESRLKPINPRCVTEVFVQFSLSLGINRPYIFTF